jgi:hypothetical protein
MFAEFSEKVLELRNNPLPRKSYTSLPKLLSKIFTYAPLRFRKNMFAAHDFSEKVLELRNNPPLNPTAYKILHVSP